MKAKYSQEQLDIAILKSQHDLMQGSLDRIEKTIIEGFVSIDKRFEKIDDQFEKMNLNFEKRFDRIENNFEKVHARIFLTQEKIDSNFKFTITAIMGIYAFGLSTLLGVVGHAYHWF